MDYLTELKTFLKMKDEEIASLRESQIKLKSSSSQASLSQDHKLNEVLRREIDRLRKKNDVCESVIGQLKKELEKYAYELIKLQEI
jgi:hypothetical protein